MHAVSVDAQAQQPTAQDTARSTAMKAGNSISKARVGMSAAMVASGTLSEPASLSVIITCVRNAFELGEPLQPRPLTTSRLKLMGVPMMIRTSKACAGPVTERKPVVNVSSDIDSHLSRGRGGRGQIPDGEGQKDRRLAFFHTAAG